MRTSGRRCCSAASAPSVSTSGATERNTLRRISMSSSQRKRLKRGRSSLMEASRPRTGASRHTFSAMCSRTCWFIAATGTPAGSWGSAESSLRTGKICESTVAESSFAQNAPRLLAAALRTSTSRSADMSCRYAATWSRMGRAGAMADESLTKFLALITRIAEHFSVDTLSKNAPKYLAASSGVSFSTIFTMLSTAISRTLSCRSTDSSLKSGLSSPRNTSFSTTAASAGKCAKAALRTIGISSLASCSYCLRRLGRDPAGVEG
mmetsp:Transcript_40057/g.94990  ORF Transcript_40057/g.94990 Transcript_40057/m.94990 type:complete len:264 (+) Transcript_40057:58-849(+)